MLRIHWTILLALISPFFGQSQTASFSANPTTGCTAPHNVFFTDMSTGPDTWAWDFGDGNTSTLQNPNHTYLGLGSFVVVLTVTDTVTGGTSSFSLTITVGDNDPPSITCPANQNVFFDSQCRYILPDYTSMATTSDNCDPSPVLSQSPAAGSFIFSTTTITLTSTDASGNSATCTFDVIPSDNTPPTATCPGTQTDFFDANCAYILPNYTPFVTTSDNCATTINLTQSPTAGTQVTANTTITMIADDGNGNVSICSFNLTLTDTIDPVLTCPANQTVSFDANCDYDMIDFTSMSSANDNCSAVTLTQFPNTGTTITATTSVTITGTDASGNSSSCNFDVIPVDDTEPTITCPSNQTGYLDQNCENATPDFTAMAVVTDNCDLAPMLSQNPMAGTTYSGTTPFSVTLYAQDASGNIDSCGFTFTPLDTISPIITCPGNITSCDPVVNYSLPTTSDNCSAVTITQIAGLGSGSSFPVGVTTNTFEVSDLSGNTSTCSFDVEVFDLPSVSATGTDPLCFGGATGTADATVTGGAPNYFYNWSNGSTLEDPTGLTAGTYVVVVTDNNGCQDSTNVTIQDPDAIIAEESAFNVTCYGLSDGSIDITSSGGTGNLSYFWSNGSSSEDLNGLSGGTYTLTITDDNGCQEIVSVTIFEPDSISISASSSTFSHGHNISVNGESDGEIDVSVTGGTQPYNYSWSNGSSDQNLNNLPAGTYTLTVTDGKGCAKTIEVILTEPEPVEPANAFTPNGDGYNDFFTIKNIEDFPTNKLSVMNRWGEVVYKSSPYQNDWDGRANRGIKLLGKDLPEGSYFYILVVEKGTKPVKGYIVLKR